MADTELTEGYIRSRFRDIGNGAMARYVSLARSTPLSHSELSVGSSPVSLPSVPSGTRRTVLYAVSNDVTFTDAPGDSPSASHGMIIPANTPYVYDSEIPADFKLWAATATDVRVAFYG